MVMRFYTRPACAAIVAHVLVRDAMTNSGVQGPFFFLFFFFRILCYILVRTYVSGAALVQKGPSNLSLPLSPWAGCLTFSIGVRARVGDDDVMPVGITTRPVLFSVVFGLLLVVFCPPLFRPSPSPARRPPKRGVGYVHHNLHGRSSKSPLFMLLLPVSPVGRWPVSIARNARSHTHTRRGLLLLLLPRTSSPAPLAPPTPAVRPLFFLDSSWPRFVTPPPPNGRGRACSFYSLSLSSSLSLFLYYLSSVRSCVASHAHTHTHVPPPPVCVCARVGK